MQMWTDTVSMKSQSFYILIELIARPASHTGDRVKFTSVWNLRLLNVTCHDNFSPSLILSMLERLQHEEREVSTNPAAAAHYCLASLVCNPVGELVSNSLDAKHLHMIESRHIWLESQWRFFGRQPHVIWRTWTKSRDAERGKKEKKSRWKPPVGQLTRVIINIACLSVIAQERERETFQPVGRMIL